MRLTQPAAAQSSFGRLSVAVPTRMEVSITAMPPPENLCFLCSGPPSPVSAINQSTIILVQPLDGGLMTTCPKQSRKLPQFGANALLPLATRTCWECPPATRTCWEESQCHRSRRWCKWLHQSHASFLEDQQSLKILNFSCLQGPGPGPSGPIWGQQISKNTYENSP